jgi:hypothetical protein
VHKVLQCLKDTVGYGYLKGPVGEGSAVGKFAVLL